MADPENWPKLGSNCDKRSTQLLLLFFFYDSVIIHLGCQVELSKSILRALCINQFDASTRREDMVSITNKKRSQHKDEIQQ